MAGSGSTSDRGYTARDGRSSTFDRSMASHLKSKTPYNYSVLEPEEAKNTKYKYFQHVGMRRPEAIAKNSVTLNNAFNNTSFSSIERDKTFGDVMYATVSEDKPGRLRDYRTMGAFSEVADALDEICDEAINPDEDGVIVKLNFKNSDIDSYRKEEINDEWDRYIEYYDLLNNGWRYFRQLLIEGELFFEQIIHEDYTNEGILGVINIPADSIDPVYSNIQNMLVKGFLYKKPIFDKADPRKVEKYEYIPFEENQVVYSNSSSYNDTKEFVVPFIENCRRAYRQLSMTEDAIIINRMVHAPLRFVFNVDVGRMPVPQAEAYLRKLQSQYWSTKTFDMDQSDVVKKYNPQSMLDSYWFAKRQGQDPTTVEEIGGTANLDELSDLYYFIKKLYRSLKVPSSRLDPDDAFQDGTQILREELKFANMVRRHQQLFAAGLKRGFVTHLKLRKMFSEYDLCEQNVNIEFNPPSNFYDLRNNQKMELKITSYNNMVSTGKISDSFAKKKVLQWKDRDILAERELRRVDAELDWEIAQITAMGPNWKAQMVAQAQAGTPAGAEPAMGGGMPPGGGGPSAFTGGPADLSGGDMGGTPPEMPEMGDAPEDLPPA